MSEYLSVVTSELVIEIYQLLITFISISSNDIGMSFLVTIIIVWFMFQHEIRNSHPRTNSRAWSRTKINFLPGLTDSCESCNL